MPFTQSLSSPIDTRPNPDIKQILDALPAALFIKDAHSNILLMNRACEEQWGMTSAEVCGTTGHLLFPPEQMELFLAKDREVFAGGHQVEFEEPIWNAKLQENRMGFTIKRPIYSSAGTPLYLVCISIDITERKQAESNLAASDAKLRALYELAPLGIARTDMQGHYIEFNKAFERICGYSREALNKLDYWALTPEKYALQEAEQLQSLTSNGVYGPYEKEYIRSDGALIPLRLTGVLIRGGDGEPYIWSIVEDITESKRSAETIKFAELIYDSSNEATVITDEKNCIVHANAAYTRVTGYALDEVIGKDPNILQSGLHNREFYDHLWTAVRERGQWSGEIWDRRKDGELFAKWMNISVVRNPDGKIYRHIAHFSDLTEKKQKDELIWRQANYDMLTNLPNRRLFRDRLEQEIRKNIRAYDRLALLFIDLDHFKEINDTLGHDKGDQLLYQSAQRIQNCVRDSDTLARLGGDEFTVIIPACGTTAQAERIAQNIIDALNAPFILEGNQIYISASVGITICPDDATDVENLLKHADQAMYQAKSQGRNRYAFFTASMQREAQEKLSLTNDLRHALERNELTVYYQPIIDLQDGRIIKAEALLRWKHAQRGMVSPAEFIPLAEDSGLISSIGDWVFHEAIDAVTRLHRTAGRVIGICVNKSPVQFRDGNENSRWHRSLAALDLPGNTITVEITEGVLIKDSPSVKKRLLEFQSLGIGVSIDDFGTGFSSLSYLKQFDVDFLKIDRSFICDLEEDPSDRALTEAIIVMAHKLGIKTIAEGVETELQKEMLMKFGCDYAQGYLFSPAVPIDDFEKLLGCDLR